MKQISKVNPNGSTKCRFPYGLDVTSDGALWVPVASKTALDVFKHFPDWQGKILFVRHNRVSQMCRDGIGAAAFYFMFHQGVFRQRVVHACINGV